MTDIKPKQDWYRLDNAAVIFSLITSKHLPAVFRLKVSFEEIINYDLMQVALDKIQARFPYFQVQLRKGLFWYHLAHNSSKPQLLPETPYPCKYIPVYQKNTLPYVVRIYGKQLSIEFHHGITDGTGARVFLYSLAAAYLEERGTKIDESDSIFIPENPVSKEEYEDAFKRYYQEEIPHLPRYTQAFQLPFKLDPHDRFYVTSGEITIADLKKISSSYQITVTELLVAIYLDSLQNVYLNLDPYTRSKLTRPIRVSVATNLRNYFQTKTLRNFSLHVVAGIDPRLGKYEFNEIVKIVHHNLHVDINKKDFLRQIKRNVRGEMHPLMRVTPLFLKNIFGEYIYSIFGERQFSGSLSNLGDITPNGNLKDKITSFEFIPSRNKIRKVNCSVSGFKDMITINFGSTTQNHSVERYFFRKLRQLGAAIRVKTNY